MFCPKCGAGLPDDVAFCGKCGHRLAVERTASQPPAVSAPVQAPSQENAGSVMATVRLVIVVVFLVFMFLPLPWFEYKGALSGSTVFALMDLPDISSDLILPVFGAWAALAIALLGAVGEVITKNTAGRWVSLVGFAVFIVVALVMVTGFADSASLFGYQVASVGPTVVPWLSMLFAAAGAVTCFIKR